MSSQAHYLRHYQPCGAAVARSSGISTVLITTHANVVLCSQSNNSNNKKNLYESLPLPRNTALFMLMKGACLLIWTRPATSHNGPELCYHHLPLCTTILTQTLLEAGVGGWRGIEKSTAVTWRLWRVKQCRGQCRGQCFCFTIALHACEETGWVGGMASYPEHRFPKSLSLCWCATGVTCIMSV